MLSRAWFSKECALLFFCRIVAFFRFYGNLLTSSASTSVAIYSTMIYKAHSCFIRACQINENLPVTDDHLLYQSPHSYAYRVITILFTVLRYSTYSYFIVNEIILPNFRNFRNWFRCILFSQTITTSPAFDGSSLINHFLRVICNGKYSRSHLR